MECAAPRLTCHPASRPAISAHGTELIAWLRQRLPPIRCCGWGRATTRPCCAWPASSECVVTVDMLTDHVDFELARGRSAAGGPQGPGGQPQRPGGDGQPAAGGRGGRGPAAAGRHGTGRANCTKACCRWPSSTTWPSPAATPTVGTGRWSLSITLLGQVTGRGPLLPRRGPARRPHPRHRLVRRQHPRAGTSISSPASARPCC